jgi:hypothetical protein
MTGAPNPTGPEATPAQDNSIEGVRRWVHEQGYELEHEARRHLLSAGFTPAWLGLTYRSPNTEKFREVDVVARCALTSPVGMYAVVECKRSTKAWVVRMSYRKAEQFKWSPIASPGVARAVQDNWAILQMAFPLEPSIGFDVVQAHASPKEMNPAYSALSQVVDAAAGLLDSTSFMHDPKFLYPILVVDTPLYRLGYSDEGAEELEAVEWQRVVWSGSSMGVPIAIDVVRRSAFEAHARRLRLAFGDLADRLPDPLPPPPSMIA